MNSESEKYYARKNREVEAKKNAATEAFLIKLAFGLVVICIFFIFLLAPGELVAYAAFKLMFPQFGPGKLWYISVAFSFLVLLILYFLQNSDFGRALKSYLILCGILSTIVVSLYVFEYKYVMDLPKAFWPFNDSHPETVKSETAASTEHGAKTSIISKKEKSENIFINDNAIRDEVEKSGSGDW